MAALASLRKSKLFDFMFMINGAFRMLTRAILIVIVLGMFGYLGFFLYFVGGRSWSLPVILTPGHERVVIFQRDAIERALKLAEIRDRLSAIDRQVAEMRTAERVARLTLASVETDIVRERTAIAQDREILNISGARLATERAEAERILESLRAEGRTEEELAARVIDRSRFLAEMLLRTNLSLSITRLEVDMNEIGARIRELDRRLAEAEALEATIAGDETNAPRFSEASKFDLYLKAQTTLALFEAETARIEAARTNLSALEANLARSIEVLESSPLARATTGTAVVLFVPYDNAAQFVEGQPVFRCALWIFACSQAGTVGTVADGEMMLPHPFFNRPVRGAFFEVDGIEAETAKDNLLFSRRPAFF